MARQRKINEKAALDLEAIGLVLLALGLFTAGFLMPALPTGDLGEGLRGLLLGAVGWGAYTLPWPLLVLGALFFFRRNPKGWPRLLLGYGLACLGLWMLLMLFYPQESGALGERLRTLLAGAAGWLAVLPALLVLGLGIELIFARPPLYLVRNGTRLVFRSVRRFVSSLLAARRRLKARAAFGADVALARGALKELDKDLEALKSLYPGSAELANWRQAVTRARRRLASADEAVLAGIEADIEAWQNAVAGFSQDRAQEFRRRLDGEGLEGFAAWHERAASQLAEPFGGTVKPARALEEIRRALLFDLRALHGRFDGLSRERDHAEKTLQDTRPRALLGAMAQHQSRLKAYAEIARAQAELESDSAKLAPWRELMRRLERLRHDHGDAGEVEALLGRLSEVLRKQGRRALETHERWEQEIVALDQEPDVDAHAAIEAENPLEPEPREVSVQLTNEREDELEDDEPIVREPEADEAVGALPLQLPGYSLLDERSKLDDSPLEQAREAQERVRKIDETLNNFKLQGRVVSAVRGPTVTRFEVEPAPGEKISRFATLSDDLALAMAVGSVRIEAPIPGKSVIGLEVPNASRDLITFREAVESAAFRRSKARLPLILGKSIDGEMIVGDLAKMPHLLIAGSTGSGKSVAVNTLVGSLLYKFLPTELRLLMIDPKMVELTPYDGIPHMVRPVVTNPGDAAGVLLGTVAHMERRYKMMSKIGAKTLDQYNDKARNLDLPELPFIVIIIDELADLMITSPKEVESAIMRLAQMARATGMHLVLATQRPSVDILTSLIKVNVPARIAFAVSSGHDSRTILDTMGAERLTGLGDMLFYQPGLVKPVRLQGPFITEAETLNLSAFLRRQVFEDDFIEAYGADFDPLPLDDSSASGLVDWDDDKLREAAELVIQEGQASVSRLQRRLGVGHARAGKLMDSLEALAVVGPHLGSKPREVLVTMEELPNIFGK